MFCKSAVNVVVVVEFSWIDSRLTVPQRVREERGELKAHNNDFIAKEKCHLKLRAHDRIILEPVPSLSFDALRQGTHINEDAREWWSPGVPRN